MPASVEHQLRLLDREIARLLRKLRDTPPAYRRNAEDRLNKRLEQRHRLQTPLQH